MPASAGIIRSAANEPPISKRDLRVDGNQRSAIYVAPIEMTREIKVVELVAKISVVPDAGEQVQEEFAGAQRDHNSDGKLRYASG